MLDGGDAEGANRLVAKLGESGDARIDVLEQWRKRIKQLFSDLGRRHTARRSGQQSQANILFEPTDNLTQRRLRDCESCSGSRETLFLGDSHEGGQVGNLVPFH